MLCCISSHAVAVANGKPITVQKGTCARSNVALSEQKAPGSLVLQRDANTVFHDRELGACVWTWDVLFRKQSCRGLVSINMLGNSEDR